jgi:peptidoglycan/LPS O-acetylase OafA/YrhL
MGKDIPGLTALRGVAALAVMLFHLDLYILRDASSGFKPMLAYATMAVDLFFILSGFVLAHAYGAGFMTRIDLAGFAHFLRQRLARIYPLHFATLIASLALYVLLPDPFGFVDFSSSSFLRHLTLTQGWLPNPSWNSPSWSVSVEWQCYLLFPAIAWVVTRLPKGWAWAAIVACLLIPTLLPGRVGFHTVGLLTIARGLPEFAAGMVLYGVFATGRLRAYFAGDVVFAMLAVSVIAVAVCGFSDALILALLPPLILSATWNEGRAASLLSAAPLQWLGAVSYSVYLVHTPIVALLFAPMVAAEVIFPSAVTRPVLFALAICMTLAIADIVHRRFEVPARNYLRRVKLMRVPARA